jgi:lipoprotein-releasing system permease protein
MKATRFISSRIFSFSKENLSSVVMKIAVVSIALGISIMLISIAVIVGFKNQIKEKVVGFVNPIQIQVLNQNESIEETPFVYDSVLKSKLDLPFIKSIYPTANKAGLVKTDTEIHGIVLKGVGENYDWNYMNSNLIAGNVPQYLENERSNDIVISKIISDKMMLDVGDEVRIWFIGENMKTRGRKFLIKGIYETGLTECDERFIYCDLNQIRRLNGWDENMVGHLEIDVVDGVDPAVAEVFLADQIQHEIVAHFRGMADALLQGYIAFHQLDDIDIALAIVDTRIDFPLNILFQFAKLFQVFCVECSSFSRHIGVTELIG